MYGLGSGVLYLFTRSVYFINIITCQGLKGLYSRGHEMVPVKYHVSLFSSRLIKGITYSYVQ